MGLERYVAYHSFTVSNRPWIRWVCCGRAPRFDAPRDPRWYRRGRVGGRVRGGGTRSRGGGGDAGGGGGSTLHLGMLGANCYATDPTYQVTSDLDTSVRCKPMSRALGEKSEQPREMAQIRDMQCRLYDANHGAFANKNS